MAIFAALSLTPRVSPLLFLLLELESYFVLLTFIPHGVKPTGFGIKITSFLLFHVFPEFLSPSTDAASGKVLINVCNEYKSEA